MKAKKPVQFLITGTKINVACSIESFNYSEGDNEIGDRNFDIVLKEYKTASPRKIKQKKKRKRSARPKLHPKHIPSKKGIRFGTSPVSFTENTQSGGKSGTRIKPP